MSDRYLGWLEANQTQMPQIATHLTEFGDYYQRRLWHQLTIALEQRINQPEFQRDASYLPELYDKFIAGFAYRLNPLKLAKIAVVVSKQYSQADKAGTASRKCLNVQCGAHQLLII
jgi:26S proteasome regulatory subunit N9